MFRVVSVAAVAYGHLQEVLHGIGQVTETEGLSYPTNQVKQVLLPLFSIDKLS
jgi:hypothetical protein